MKFSLPFASSPILKSAAILLIALSASIGSAQSSIFPLLPPSVSTIPANGDLNPYGIAIAPSNLPPGPGLQPGDILVTNFNNNNNLQGLGTTIVRINKYGNVSTFYTASPQRSGLSGAIGILSDGLVLVGNVPTLDGTPATIMPGNFSVLDRVGDFLGTFGTISSVDGPWGMALVDKGNGVNGTAHVFLSNVLSGTVSRFDLVYTASSINASVLTLATGFNHRTDPAAIVLGPSGLVYSPSNDTLYVASSTDNAIYKIATATTAGSPVNATLFFNDNQHLHGPLDLVILPNGHFVVANSDGSNADPNEPSELVEYTAAGSFVNQMSIDPNNGGAFGLATSNLGWGTIRFLAVDDNSNRLNIWTTVVH